MSKRIKTSQYTYNDVPTIRRSRTAFPINYDVKSTLNIGEISVIDIQETIPGDTFDCSISAVCRATSSYLRPVLDNAFLDIHTFWVPKRVLYKDWTKLYTNSNGDGEPDDWQNVPEYKEPCLPKNTIIPQNTIGDALGLPTGVPLGCEVSVLPFRAFAKIYNDWYRKEAFIKSTYIQTGDYNSEVETPNNNEWSPANYMGKLPKASKFADYFTSALPKPQKGDPIPIPLAQGNIPVTTTAQQVTEPKFPLRLWDATMQRSISFNGTTDLKQLFVGNGSFNDGETSERDAQLRLDNGVASQTAVNSLGVAPSNLVVDMTKALLSNINDFRLAVQLSRLRERSARSGNRYVEFVLSNFNVNVGDSTLGRAEFLSGRRLPLSYTSVSQTSQSNGEDTLGSQGAYGLTLGRSGYKKSFTECGYIITTAVIRYNHNYQQGIAPLWRRLDNISQVNPTLAHIGEQPIYTTEIDGTADGERIFGYKPVYEEMRRFQNKITRQMRSLSAGGSVVSQDVWHYADVYSGVPTLSKEFIEENPAFMGRTLAVSPTEQDPFMVDVFFSGRAVRCLPMFGTPELVDHF